MFLLDGWRRGLRFEVVVFLFVGMNVPVSIITKEEKRIGDIVMVLMLILKKCIFSFVTFIGLQGDVDKRFTPNKRKERKRISDMIWKFQR